MIIELENKFGNIYDIETELKIQKNNTEEIKQYIRNNCNSPREALTFSAKYLTSQSYGGVLESFFKKYFNLSKIKESQDGDLNSKLGKIEVKVSIEHKTTKHIQFCMMQLRPAHNVDYYLGVFYSYSESFIKYILVPSSKMKDIIEIYCSSYSHGTQKGKGKPVREKWEKDTEAEFQITFSVTPSNNRNYKIWKELEPFVCLEQDLFNKLK